MRNNYIVLLFTLIFWTILFIVNHFDDSSYHRESNLSVNSESDNYFAKGDNIEQSIKEENKRYQALQTISNKFIVNT